MTNQKRIWTIGHSTRSEEEFLGLLRMHNIRMLADVRAFPGSRKFPHFNREHLQEALSVENMEYLHMPGLGGRRKPDTDSRNTAWRHPSFRAYADYMESAEFRDEIGKLQALAARQPVAMMCSEAPWWKCHRALLSDYLKASGWEVLHIMEKGRLTEHPYTSPARVSQGKLNYEEKED